MTHSSAHKWLVIVFLPLTIAWKVVVKPENPVEIQNAILEFLAKQRFDVNVTDEGMEYMGVIEARSPSCRLRVARVSPLGHETFLVRHGSATSDRAFYVFRGAVYAEQPVRLTIASYFWFRFLRELGLVTRVPSVLAVVTSCAAEQLPWSELGSQEPT
ncbi:hypothetical protein AC629_04335 [Bradyrhizobium sp. NAS80.1]|uniref:hypothetical protein n=1 Tax=Bradyrhizobium sp. NAS80.1 TaxID=1680159 RepID=UPI0009592971|nr:hypothetical protein [Bradyrhizobium sp. NAS80.1]OKO90690.1 hypothetical protein AC629_04335 [Bradyrhizobium sp. NAS80.1]